MCYQASHHKKKNTRLQMPPIRRRPHSMQMPPIEFLSSFLHRLMPFLQIIHASICNLAIEAEESDWFCMYKVRGVIVPNLGTATSKTNINP